MTAVGRPRVVVPATLLAAAVTVISGSRVWLRGESAEPGLAGAAVSATGTQTVPGLVALGLVIGAATVAAATAGAVVRRLTLVVAAAASAALALVAAQAVTGADAILGRQAAGASGRTGQVAVTASVTWWPWIVLAVALLALAAVVTGLVAASSWRGLSERYDAPAEAGVAGSRGQRVAADWDRLDRGDDPTQ